MDDGCAADEGIEKTQHEINRVVRWKNAEVGCTRPEGIQSRKCYALLEIVFVGHHAAFGSAAGAGGVDDGRDVAALTRDEHGFAVAAEFFPAFCAGEIGVWRGFRDENGFQICGETARWRPDELPPDWIFGDENACA